MSLNILIAPDKFKGTLSAPEAAAAIARGWHQVRPDDNLDLLPITDGGDGFGPLLAELCGGRNFRSQTVDAAHRKCSAPWWQLPDGTAVIESASIIGLAMLSAKKFHPYDLDSYGVGRLLSKLAGQGHTRVMVAIGGSATNDGGFGFARGLGWEFLDEDGQAIEEWTEILNLVSLRPPAKPARFKEVVAAVDVQNPLLGSEGATHVYGPQKGLSKPEIEATEGCLQHLAKVVKEHFGKDYSKFPGAGAAGGLGFAMKAFLNAEFNSGFDIFARHADLRKRIKAADVILTGEGSIDESTLMGKGVGQLAKLCKEAKLPCLGLSGVVEAEAKNNRLFTKVSALTEITNGRQAETAPAVWLERLAAREAEAFAE